MEYNQDMKNRLKRIEGQVRGVLYDGRRKKIAERLLPS